MLEKTKRKDEKMEKEISKKALKIVFLVVVNKEGFFKAFLENLANTMSVWKVKNVYFR